MITSTVENELNDLGFLNKNIGDLSYWESEVFIITELKNPIGYALYKKTFNQVPDKLNENGEALSMKNVYTGLASSVEKIEVVGEYNVELKQLETERKAKIYPTIQEAINVYKSVKNGNTTS